MRFQYAFAVCAVALCLAQAAHGGDGDIEISSQPKKIEDVAAAGRGADEVAKSQKWGYSVTLENKTFNLVDNLEVQYIIFYKHEQLGIKGPPQKKRISGTYTVKEIPSLGKVSFDTDSVELTKALLIGQVGGYTYFTNGAKPRAEDSLTGVWIRVYRNGNLFGEFADPSDITSSETWE